VASVDIPLIPALEPLLHPFRYKGLYGGRGGAKSHGFGDLLIDDCITHRGLRAVCIREYQVSLEQSVKRLLEDKINTYGLNHEFLVRDAHIETPGDGIIIFQGMQSHNAESIKSLEGYDRAWVEEAQNLSQRSLDLLRPTIREPGSELWFSWNPLDPKDPVDKFLRSVPPPPDSIVIRTTYRDNPFFPEVLRREMEWDRGRDIDKYTHIWEGGYAARSEARVFKNFVVREFETPSDATLLFGGDWGFSVDPSVLVRLWTKGRKLYIDHEAYRIGVEIDHLPSFFDTVPGSREWPIRADSARPETISYLQRHGFPRITPAIKGANSVKEGVIFLQGFDVIIHPRCIHTVDEFTDYAYKVDKKTQIVTPFLEDKKNHVIDSVRYAIEELRLEGFDWEEAGMTSDATW
jgi:phage terminase large subunit